METALTIINSNIDNYNTRAEERMDLPVTLYVRPAANCYSFKREVITENVSPHGAAILCGKSFPIDSLLEVSNLSGSFFLRAKVRHIKLRGDGRWSIGLQFFHKNSNWIFA